MFIIDLQYLTNGTIFTLYQNIKHFFPYQMPLRILLKLRRAEEVDSPTLEKESTSILHPSKTAKKGLKLKKNIPI